MNRPISIVSALILAGSPAFARSIHFGPGGGIPDFVGSTPGVMVSDIVVPDSFAVTDITVTLDALSHTWCGDLAVTLQKIGGPTATLVNRIGVVTPGSFGDSSDYGGMYTFSNLGGPPPGPDLWFEATLGASSYVLRSGEYRASGAGSGAGTNSLAAFTGLNSAGTWRLTITDNAGGDVGMLGSWMLNIVPTPPTTMLVATVGLACRRRRTC